MVRWLVLVAALALAGPGRMLRIQKRAVELDRVGEGPEVHWRRRWFLAACAGVAGAFAVRTVRAETPLRLRPPGALDEQSFTGVCVRCGNCAQVCPTRIVQPDFGTNGVAGFLTPRLRFDDDYCREDVIERLALIFCLGWAAWVAPAAAAQPNIVLFLADDLGWADVSWHGSPYKLPHLDRLAREGVKLEAHYVHPMCSPTRAALLTGRYASRFGVTAAQNQRALPWETVTLATALKSAGYDTALIGKWHLGSKPEEGPQKFGFDHAYGSLAGGCGPYDHRYKEGEFSRTWHRNGGLVEEEGHVTDLIAREAVRWLEQRAQKPFFLYVPFTAIHVPIREPEPWLQANAHLADPAQRLRAACATHMDHAIGQVLAVLDRKRLRDDTLVILLSDNGAHAPGDNQGGPYPGEYERLQVGNDNRPLRGHKSGVYEGGIRTPGVAHWPARLKPAEIHTPLHAVDWMPTLCTLAGAKATGDPKWDGKDIWPALTQPGLAWPARTLYSAAPGFRAQMVRHGDWKLLVHRTGPGQRAKKQATPSEELYNLAHDLSESRNVAADHPGTLAEMKRRLTEVSARDKDSMVAALPAAAPVPSGPATTPPSLAALAQRIRPGFLLGSMAGGLDVSGDGRSQSAEFFHRNFNIMTVGVYMQSTQRKPDTFDFAKTDAPIAWAHEHKLKVHLHPLIGGAEYTPKWVNEGTFSAETLEKILRDRITTILTRYRGRIHYVDVVNESLTGKGRRADGQFDWQEKAYRGGDHVWFKTLGMYQGRKHQFPRYLVEAFRVAREAGGPDLKLILNEWANETTASFRAEAFLALIQALREEGVPVDGAGLQLHCRLKAGKLHGWASNVPFDFDAFDAMLRRYEQAGIEVHITEFDIHLEPNPTPGDFELQGEFYARVLQHALRSPAVKSFKTWGFTDGHSWKADGVDGHPLLLDEDLKPKSAYLRQVEMLRTLGSPR